MYEHDEDTIKIFDTFSTEVLIDSVVRYSHILKQDTAKKNFFRNRMYLGGLMTSAYAGFAGYSFVEVARGYSEMNAVAVLTTTLAGLSAWATGMQRDSMKYEERQIDVTESLLSATQSVLQSRTRAA